MDSQNTHPNHTKTDIGKIKFLWCTSHRYVRYVCQIDTPVVIRLLQNFRRLWITVVTVDKPVDNRRRAVGRVARERPVDNFCQADTRNRYKNFTRIR